MCRKRISETDFRRLNEYRLEQASSKCCGYLRNPDLIGTNYITGTCCLQDNKVCEGNLPQNTESCQVYQRFIQKIKGDTSLEHNLTQTKLIQNRALDGQTDFTPITLDDFSGVGK